MYFLNICRNPDILRIIYFALKILDILFIIIPIGLIIMLTIDIFKIVISGDEKTQSKSIKFIINRIIFALLIFFVPTIVTATMNLLETANISVGGRYKECLENANKEDIDNFQVVQDALEQLENNNNNNGNGNNVDNNISQNVYNVLATEMVNIATGEIGHTEGSNNSNKYGETLGINNQPWCAIFVTWVGKQVSSGSANLFNDIINKFNNFDGFASSTATLVHFANSSNLNFYYSKHYGGTYTPKKGDYIFFNYSTSTWNKKTDKDVEGTGICEHIGIVISVENNKVITIEGNTGSGQVKKKEYGLNNTSILGYGSWYN